MFDCWISWLLISADAQEMLSRRAGIGCSLPPILYNSPKILRGGILEPLASAVPRYPSLPPGCPVLETRTRSFIRPFLAGILFFMYKYISFFLEDFLPLENREKSQGGNTGEEFAEPRDELGGRDLRGKRKRRE